MGFWRSKRETPKGPVPPESLLLGVGPGDYLETGRRTFALLEKLAGLRASVRVLDVGCGLGRIAWTLAGKLEGRGSYTGLDAPDAPFPGGARSSPRPGRARGRCGL